MARSLALQSALDDALQSLRVETFNGGLNSDADPNDLGLDSSPDCQNVKILKDGRITGRDGYLPSISGLPAAVSDGHCWFNDSTTTRRRYVWNNGSIYDISNGATATLVAAAIYTAGRRVAWCILDNVLYYSDGIIPLRQYNPVTGIEQAVANSGGIGVIAPVSATVLCVYDGQIIAGAPIAAGVYEPHSLRWCDVNDPTVWRATNIYKVGNGIGGYINSIVQFGIANVGISPFSALFVGKSEMGCFAMSGATSAFTSLALNVPVGVRDGATVKYIPGPDGAGYMVFLGTDFRVWYTNGSQSGELSQNIRGELSRYIQDRLAVSNQSKFTAALNFLDNQYILDCSGDRQYAYDWNKKAWTRYEGWPSGYWSEPPDGNGVPTIWVADSNNRVCRCNAGLDDNGVAIAPYWTTPDLHCGAPDTLKQFINVLVEYSTDIGNIVITPVVNDGAGYSYSLTIDPPDSSGDGSARWGTAIWGASVWGSSGELDFHFYKRKRRLQQLNPNTGTYVNLKGYNVRFKIATTTQNAYFHVLSIALEYLIRGRKHVGRRTF